MSNVRDQWQALADEGAWVFPLPPGGKNPGDLGVKWQGTWIGNNRNPWPQLASVHFDAAGLWLATGQISKRVVLDIDKPSAGGMWRDLIGPDLFDRALRVTTRKGFHLHFLIPADDDAPFPGHSDNEIGYDLRADGGGVVVPPSVHASGHVYEWAGGELLPYPPALRHPLRAEPTNVISLNRASRTADTGRPRSSSTLTQLLANPPEAEGDGRNNWLTKVAGHLATLWPAPMADAYAQLVLHLGTSLADPMDPDEAEKVASSIWERQTGRTDLQCPPESGWLSGDGQKLYTRRKGEDGGIYVSEWADFDMRARRVVQEGEERVFYVDLVTAHTTYPDEPVRAGVLGNVHQMNVWLAAHHCSIVGHDADLCKVAYGTRLMRYLLAQAPQMSRTALHYGQQPDGAFLIPEGRIEGGGVVPHTDAVPAAQLEGWAHYRYGVCPPDEALSVLREVLTFQEETTASVFAAWWCMALLKGRYQSSLFPFMMLDATSGSGKTMGFFSHMVALAGSMDGAAQYTTASFRDAVAAHRNGIAWLDDMTDLNAGQVVDIIRQATSEGARSKKSSDNRTSEMVPLLCPILFSGEGTGTTLSEKAMADRSVRLQFSSPKDRRSLRDPGADQWQDVLALQTRYGGTVQGLTAVAGTLVALVLAADAPLSELPELRAGGGRHSDKMAILRTGARVLSQLTGDPSHIRRVDDWVSAQLDTKEINLALNEVIPWALRAAMHPTSARGWQSAYHDLADDTVWVSVARLADQWKNRNNLSPRERQLGAEDAIRAELRANGCDTKTKTQYTDLTKDSREAKRYVHLSPELSRHVLDRADIPPAA